MVGYNLVEKKGDLSIKQKLYRVLVGAYSVEANADAMIKKLKDKGFDASKVIYYK